MGSYLYCIGQAGHPRPHQVSGIGGAPVRHLEVAELAAWVSPLGSAPTPSLERVREHNAVVERACAEHTVLPLRFGQWFADRAALDALVLERKEALVAGLERVAGAMEMGVRVLSTGSDDNPPDRSTGRAYLEALARRGTRASEARARGAAIAAELTEWVGGLARAVRSRPLGTAAGLVSIDYLVARHDTSDYNARVRTFPARHSDLRFLFSGPWPPYGFADE